MKKRLWIRILAALAAFVLLTTFAMSSIAGTHDGNVSEETVNGFTIAQLAEAFHNRDTVTLHAYLKAFAPQDFQESFPPTIRPFWQSDPWLNNEEKMTHASLTAIGLLLYVGDMQSLFGKPNGFGYTLSEWSVLNNFSEEPDRSSLSANADHFYDPDTGKNWNNNLTRNAKEAIDNYYQKALNQFSSNRAEAIKNLGRALHFIQDLNEPHHAANITVLTPGSQHSNFEHYAATRVQDALDTIQGSPDRSLYHFASAHSAGDLLHDAALKAKLYVWVANQPQWDGWIWAARETLHRSAAYSAALLYKFAKETEMI